MHTDHHSSLKNMNENQLGPNVYHSLYLGTVLFLKLGKFHFI